ncbi:RNA polymerase II transcription factor-like protein [Lindgomyces ingoldianus]|uniref:RNA polymerase II transcription factor-like protein n=1 Tax=Lindgomyces ingoldianus TaxID=673940 RepID=A0ACB6R0L5_9PLEO|nr:RNA polymerase II transcription factor-like protein [Lindgomyces ingoldianus]KAF2471860.1 RNA polymerase II transcription factor-like protein [Lindgomyces ingoldianus]
MSEASAQYKKQDGKLSLSADGRTVSWKSNSGTLPPLAISVIEIQNLQQTPATATKASIKIVIQKPSASQPENHTFTFTSAAARDDQQAVTGALRKWIETFKAQNATTPLPSTENSGGPSAIGVPTQTVAASTKPEEDMYGDARLIKDAELQKSLLNSSPALRQRFDQALREKPDTISISQFATQFWATRLHLLRSHAAERAQSQGTYNVLSVVKMHTEDGTQKLSISKEQIHLIFNQHPLTKKVYNENVPPMREGDFWSRFFASRLYKKLKGEKITEQDAPDPKLDKYLNLDDDDEHSRQLTMTNVPHFIDLEGNEQNHSQRLGNRPDYTMRPNSADKVPILRVLNRMSEKMMADVPSSDADPHAPVGIDEETYQQLRLRDLQRAADDNRIILKIQNQDQFFSAEQGLHTSSSASTYTKRSPAQVLSALQHDFQSISSGKSKTAGLDLEAAIGLNNESSSDEEGSSKKPRVGSISARTGATAQINKAIRQRHSQDDDYSSSHSIASSEQAAKLGLSQSVFDTLSMTHNTTVEFLHYFWTVFYSGDSERATEVQKLVETLEKSLDRIKAVADTAENERLARLDKLRRENESYTQRTGKKKKFDPSTVKGGAKAVNEIMSPLRRAIDSATQQYKKIRQDQMGQIADRTQPNVM